MIWKSTLLMMVMLAVPAMAGTTSTYYSAAYDADRNTTLQWSRTISHGDYSGIQLSMQSGNYLNCDLKKELKWQTPVASASLATYGTAYFSPTKVAAPPHTDTVNFVCRSDMNLYGTGYNNIAYNIFTETASSAKQYLYLKQYIFKTAGFNRTQAIASPLQQPQRITLRTPEIYLQTANIAAAVMIYNGTQKLPMAASWTASATVRSQFFTKYSFGSSAEEVKTAGVGSDYNKKAWADFDITMPALPQGEYKVIAAFASVAGSGSGLYANGTVADYVVSSQFPSQPAPQPDILAELNALLSQLYAFLKASIVAAILIPGVPPL